MSLNVEVLISIKLCDYRSWTVTVTMFTFLKSMLELKWYCSVLLKNIIQLYIQYNMEHRRKHCLDC